MYAVFRNKINLIKQRASIYTKNRRHCSKQFQFKLIVSYNLQTWHNSFPIFHHCGNVFNNIVIFIFVILQVYFSWVRFFFCIQKNLSVNLAVHLYFYFVVTMLCCIISYMLLLKLINLYLWVLNPCPFVCCCCTYVKRRLFCCNIYVFFLYIFC